MSSLFLILWGLLLLSLTLVKISNETFSYSSIGEILFYSLSTIYICLFLRLSTKWRDFMEEWMKVEEAMNGLPPVKVVRKIVVVTVTVLCLAICNVFCRCIQKKKGEHLLCLLKEVQRARNCVIQGGNHRFVESFFIVYYKIVFRHVGYSLWLGVLLFIVNFILTIAWNFTDIFIICISIALAARFQQLLNSLKRVIGQDMSLDFWRESRQRYVQLSFLTKNLDERISLLLLLTFANNTYAICCMLYKALKWQHVATFHLIYYCSSFLLVVVRLFGVCFAAGKIHEISKDMLPILFSVSSQSYNIEVHRLFLQIWQDPVSLSGSRFFTITRSLVLKITGTIFTYEIVLAQFNQINPEEPSKDNRECPSIN